MMTAFQTKTLLPDTPESDPLYFRRRFDRLSEEILLHFERDSEIARAEDFDEDLGIADIFYWYADRMSQIERQFIEKFMAEWDALAERSQREQICRQCREYTPDYALKAVATISEGFRVFCKKCENNISVTSQPSLF